MSGSQMHERQTLIWRRGRAHSNRVTVDCRLPIPGFWLVKLGGRRRNEQDSRVPTLSAREILFIMMINFSRCVARSNFFCDVCILEKKTLDARFYNYNRISSLPTPWSAVVPGRWGGPLLWNRFPSLWS